MIPIELSQARLAAEEAWRRRDSAIERGENEIVSELDKACEWLEERASLVYKCWQDVGGKSDVETIALYYELLDAEWEACASPRMPYISGGDVCE